MPAGTTWESKIIRGVYISYAITNNTDEQTIRERVRYYHSQGINTIIHGVWGNACTMYNSQVMQKTLGYESCPNEFQDRWLDWLIDEAHKHGMQVHAYFEKGIKIDENSPVFDLAVARKWIVPGVDRTHPGVDHYVLDEVQSILIFPLSGKPEEAIAQVKKITDKFFCPKLENIQHKICLNKLLYIRNNIAVAMRMNYRGFLDSLI